MACVRPRSLCLAAAAAFALSAAPASAGSSAGYGMGGWFTRYDPIVAKYNASGELFRIEGRCQSACTLFLAIKNVCIEQDARLMFHGGHGGKGEISASSTAHMRRAYKPGLRRYLDAHHAMETRRFYAISGRDMIEKFGYRECPKK
jgi:hypothetical protein